MPGVVEVKFYKEPKTPIVRRGDYRDCLGHVIAASDSGARTAAILQHAVDLVDWSIAPFPTVSDQEQFATPHLPHQRQWCQVRGDDRRTFGAMSRRLVVDPTLGPKTSCRRISLKGMERSGGLVHVRLLLRLSHATGPFRNFVFRTVRKALSRSTSPQRRWSASDRRRPVAAISPKIVA